VDDATRTTVSGGALEQPKKRPRLAAPRANAKMEEQSRIGRVDDRGRLVVITDRFTAKVLGALVLVMTFLIDVSCFIFTKPEIRSRPTFPLVVIVPSLPIVALGVYLLWRANRLKAEDD
jgi:hypothetical protein